VISFKSAENFGSDQKRIRARFPLQTMLLAVMPHINNTEMNAKYIIILTFFCYSCLNMNNPDIQSRYSENYNIFDSVLVNHIPRKLPNNQIGFGFTSPEYTKLGKIYLKTKVSSRNEYLELKAKYYKQALYKGFINDSCFAIVEDYRSDFLDTNELNSPMKIFPIPKEAISYSENYSDIKKFENAEIIITECKLGDFFSRICIKSNQTTPVKAKNGFSKGYTFVEKDLIIIYWAMNW
jgi:hypothetical protein